MQWIPVSFHKRLASYDIIKKNKEGMDEYDVVYIGFPIWWYVAPTIINTFVESYDFSGKTIIPFCTSGGSGIGKTADVLKPLSPKANRKPSVMVNRMSDSELAKL